MIKKKSAAALTAAITMAAALGCTAYGEVSVAGVPLITETTAAQTAGTEISTGIVEANTVLDPGGSTGVSAAATGTGTSVQTAPSAQIVQTVPAAQTAQTAAAVQNTAAQTTSTGEITGAGPLGSSTGNNTGNTTVNTTVSSNGPTVPGSTDTGSTAAAAATAGTAASGTGVDLSGLFNTGTGTSGASTALNTLSSIPLPSNFYFSNTATYTYQNMAADLNALQAAFPSMQMSVLANTVDGRQLYHVVIGNPNAPHQILVHAGIHAREYIVSQLAMREIASLLVMQQGNLLYQGQSVAALLENTCIHFVPMVNPDGITLVQGGIDALNTETAKAQVRSIIAADGATNTTSYLRQWKNNINGVNLNRNFDAYWQEATPKVNHPSNMNYKGTSAESEIESKAIADLCRQIMPDYTISYHTQGRVIYWYFGETGTYKSKAKYLANVVHKNSGYEISDTWSKTDAAGFKDWAELKLDIPSVTIECGHGTSPVAESQISQIWEENDGILPDLLVGLMTG